MITINNQVACIPPASIAIKVVGKEKGFATAEQKTQLLKMTIAYQADGGFMPGEVAYVAGESTAAEWMKRKYSIVGGPEFVLVPVSAILMVDEPAQDPGEGLALAEVQKTLTARSSVSVSVPAGVSPVNIVGHGG